MVDSSTLSAEVQEILRTCALPISLGFSAKEVAQKLEISTIQVRWRLARAREELTGRPDPERRELEHYREAGELRMAGLAHKHVGALLGVSSSTALSWAQTWAGRSKRV
jgi:hypothetical protein